VFLQTLGGKFEGSRGDRMGSLGKVLLGDEESRYNVLCWDRGVGIDRVGKVFGIGVLNSRVDYLYTTHVLLCIRPRQPKLWQRPLLRAHPNEPARHAAAAPYFLPLPRAGNPCAVGVRGSIITIKFEGIVIFQWIHVYPENWLFRTMD
jgi:hypothetical protein